MHEDFLGALGEIKHDIKIEELKIRFNDLNELLATIDMAKGNVIAIVRGGGDTNDLMIFDEDKVLQKIADLKSYRIAGIGHSADNNLVNAVVDYSATTPTDAGNHLKEQLMQNNLDMLEISNLRQDFKYLEANVLELENKNNELQNKIVNSQTPIKQKNSNNMLIIVIIVLILIVIFK